MSAYIDVQNLTFGYSPSRAILKGFSVTIEQGERVAVTGASGCGKSTLASLLAGHLRPQSGRVLVDGREVTGRAGRDVFVVHQENDLFPWLKARDQIAVAMKHKNSKVVEDLLELMHLQNYGAAYIHQLSGGMKKRLAIARALALNPKLLILDESFASLDVPLRAELFREMREIGRTKSIALLMITHDPRDIEMFEAREIRLD